MSSAGLKAAPRLAFRALQPRLQAPVPSVSMSIGAAWAASPGEYSAHSTCTQPRNCANLHSEYTVFLNVTNYTQVWSVRLVSGSPIFFP